jgi:hypothetical protein
MAKVKNFNGKWNAAAVTEDPRPGNQGFYLFGDKHDKQSLTPVYDKFLTMGPKGGGYPTSGYDVAQSTDTINVDRTARPRNSYKLGDLQLTKQTTSVFGVTPITAASVGAGSQTASGYYDISPFWTLDRQYKLGSSVLITNADNSVSTVMLSQGQSSSGTFTENMVGFSSVPDSINLEDIPVASGQRFTITGSNHNFKYIPKVIRGGVVGIAQNFASQLFNPTYQFVNVGAAWPSTYTYSGGTAYVANLTTAETPQLIGLSLIDGAALYAQSQRGVTTTAITMKVNKILQAGATVGTAGTSTLLLNNTTLPTASGTSAGGNLLGNKSRTHLFSSTFNDTRAGANNKKCFYWPYYDVNSNYHPFLLTWDQTNDSFTRETDITITAGGLSTSNLAISLTDLYSSQATTTNDFTLNETFVLANTRYLTVMHFDGVDRYATGINGPRTFLTYSVNATNPKALTYHSQVVMPKTPKNLVWLRDDHTMMGVFMPGRFNIYLFNASTGWTLSTEILEDVFSCGRDSLDRIWYLTASTDYGLAAYDVHLLTPSIPVNVTLTPEAVDYQYSGAPISSFINVEATNAEGSRINTEVRLVIQGGSMTFSDSSIFRTLYTSNSAPVRANTIITGSGFTNVIASVDI